MHYIIYILYINNNISVNNVYININKVLHLAVTIYLNAHFRFYSPLLMQMSNSLSMECAVLLMSVLSSRIMQSMNAWLLI